MNKMVQMKKAEHQLQQIEGNPIRATRKKQATLAKDSTDPLRHIRYVCETYHLPTVHQRAQSGL